MGHERNHVRDLRGATRLAVDATKAITELVEEMHTTIGGGPAILGRPLEWATRRLTAPVYRTIRVVSELVGTGIDVALARLAALLGESRPRPEHEAVLAVLNGVLGDYLAQTENPLAIQMRFRHGGRALTLDGQSLGDALPRVGSKLLVLVHGSCLDDLRWNRNGHDHGAALAHALGYTPIYLHYNTGLHISTNGRSCAAMLEELVSAWPKPLHEIAIVGHSMGGLVARSACHYAEVADLDWRNRLRKLVCMGSPHHGAPLERAGNWVDVLLGISPYSAPLARLGRIRSAGVTDMRFGSVVDEDWQDRDRFALGDDCRSPLELPRGVLCYTIAATTALEPAPALPGDGLVPLDSALGRCARPELSLDFPTDHQFIAFATKHLALLDRPEVYAKLEAWLS